MYQKNNVTQAIGYKFLNSDVYTMQSDHRSLEKCINTTSFNSSVFFCDVLTVNLLKPSIFLTYHQV
jgi:hypothetical protein